MFLREEKVINPVKNNSPEYLVFECSGGSMRPLLPNGKKVFVDAGCNDISAGDCVCFKLDKLFFIHRVVKISGDKLILDSDSAATDTHQIDRSQIIGRLSTKNPLLKSRIGLIYHHISKYFYKRTPGVRVFFRRRFSRTPGVRKRC